MRNKITIPIFLIICIFSSAVFAADEKEKSFTDLTPWKGESVNLFNLYENEAGERFYKEILKNLPEGEGYTLKRVKEFIYNLHYMTFKTLNVVDENTIIIDDKYTGDYAHVCSLVIELSGHKTTWQVFKTDSKEMIEAGYKYFILLPYHKHGKDSVGHWHLRYGNANFDYLMTDPGLKAWWPTLYQPAITDEAKATERMTSPKVARLTAAQMKRWNQ